VDGTFHVGWSERNDPQLLGDGGVRVSIPKASEVLLKPVIALFA